MSIANRHCAAADLLLIGAEERIKILVAGFRNRRSMRPGTFTSLALPPSALLSQADAVFIYDVDCQERFEQLKMACEHQRRYGGIKLIFGFSHRLDAGLAETVLNIGALFFPL